MRDAMDSMEALASMMSYRRLPDDLEILSIGDEPSPLSSEPPPLPPISAQVIELSLFRPPHAPGPSRQTRERVAHTQGKNNKIIML